MPRNHARNAKALGFSLTLLAVGCASGGSGDAPSGPAVPADPTSSPEMTEAMAEPTATEPAAEAVVSGIFSETQADRGRTTFDEVCSECHTTSEFRGRTFQSNWGRRTVYSFFRTVRSTMPDDNPGGLEEQVYLDVVSYVLRMNGHVAGPLELSPDSPMREVRIAPPASGS